MNVPNWILLFYDTYVMQVLKNSLLVDYTFSLTSTLALTSAFLMRNTLLIRNNDISLCLNCV